MQKPLFVMFAAVMLLSSSNAYAGPYQFGDEPYFLDWGYDPHIQSGCLKWNWQQDQWNNHCPVYVQPKAYMHPGRAVLRGRRISQRSKGI
jgi:hypothetical protein